MDYSGQILVTLPITLHPGHWWWNIVVGSEYVWSSVHSFPCLTNSHRSTLVMSSTTIDYERYVAVVHQVDDDGSYLPETTVLERIERESQGRLSWEELQPRRK